MKGGMVPEDFETAVLSVYEGWYADTRIDWEDFADRMEAYGFPMGDSMLSTEILKAKKLVRGFKRTE